MSLLRRYGGIVALREMDEVGISNIIKVNVLAVGQTMSKAARA